MNIGSYEIKSDYFVEVKTTQDTRYHNNKRRATRRWLSLQLTLYRLAHAQANPSPLPQSNQTYSYHRHWFYRNENAILA